MYALHFGWEQEIKERNFALALSQKLGQTATSINLTAAVAAYSFSLHFFHYIKNVGIFLGYL